MERMWQTKNYNHFQRIAFAGTLMVAGLIEGCAGTTTDATTPGKTPTAPTISSCEATPNRWASLEHTNLNVNNIARDLGVPPEAVSAGAFGEATCQPGVMASLLDGQAIVTVHQAPVGLSERCVAVGIAGLSQNNPPVESQTYNHLFVVCPAVSASVSE